MAPSAAQLPLFHTVGFSGHRHLENPEAVAAAVRTALGQLKATGAAEWIGISSAALGGDLLFVGEARHAGMAWHALLPLAPADFRRDFSDADWAEVEQQLTTAERVQVISNSGSREDAYLDCGIETVNSCDVLLALWDGAPARGKGGTADVVAYAREIGKPIVVIDPVSCSIRQEQFERFHPGDHNLHYFNGLADAPADEAGGADVFHALKPIVAFQRKVDWTATRGAPQFRRMIAGTVLLHVLATLVAAGALSFGIHLPVLPWVKLLCLVGALGVALALRYAGAHHNWVRCRLAAEIARSALATWGLPRAAPLFEDLDLAEFRQLTRSLDVLHRRASAEQPLPMEAFKQLYLKRRVDDQLAYYRRQLHQALPQAKWLRTGFWVATVLAIVCTAAYALHATLHWGELPLRLEQLVFYFLPISLPVIAAAFLSLVSVFDLQRRVARYREMIHLLKTCRSQIAYCETWNGIERVVQRTERALLQEVLEWHSLTSFAESH